jgi:hypothetical protein
MRLRLFCILVLVMFSSVSRAQTGEGVPVFKVTPAESSVKFDVEASVAIKGKFDKWDATLTSRLLMCPPAYWISRFKRTVSTQEAE